MNTKLATLRRGLSAWRETEATRRLWFGWIFGGAMFAFVCLMSSCSTTNAVYSANPPPFEPAAPSYDRLAMEEGDTISVTFQYSTNFNTVQRIGLDGKVNLQTVGMIRAAGLTVHQFEDQLMALYKPELKDDPIIVKVVTPAAAVYVTGAVTRPGKIAMDRPMTLVDAVMEAGGYDPYRAKLSRTTVLRIENGAQMLYRVNLERALNGEETMPFYLKPFDVVRIPAKTFNF